jgi:DNA-binding GntR family transcriptional regulator
MTDWSGEPAYKQVAEDLREKIREKVLNPEDQLPSMPQLQADYGVSITVVRMAIAELRAEGTLRTHQGKGIFVQRVPGKSAASPEYVNLAEALNAVREHVHRLDERVAELEQQHAQDSKPQGASRSEQAGPPGR